MYSSNIGVQLSHEPQFDPAPSAQKLLIFLPNERPKIHRRQNLGVKPMLGLTNLALLAYVLVIVGMVIGKLVPGLIPGL